MWLYVVETEQEAGRKIRCWFWTIMSSVRVWRWMLDCALDWTRIRHGCWSCIVILLRGFKVRVFLLITWFEKQLLCFSFDYELLIIDCFRASWKHQIRCFCQQQCLWSCLSPWLSICCSDSSTLLCVTLDFLSILYSSLSRNEHRQTVLFLTLK